MEKETSTDLMLMPQVAGEEAGETEAPRRDAQGPKRCVCYTGKEAGEAQFLQTHS